jgi:hypothetical protein
MMGETALVSDSLLRDPADFSSSGGNPEIVASDTGKRPIVWHADYRQHLIVGNPLTRNGEFGPAITDYDRYVNGVDVNQTDVVQIAGGTMLGRYNGSIAPAGMGYEHMMQQNCTMGDDTDLSSLPDISDQIDTSESDLVSQFDALPADGSTSPSTWDSIGNWFSSVGSHLTTDLATGTASTINAAAQAQLKALLAGGGSGHIDSSGHLIVTHPATVVKTASLIGGVPNWVLYTGGGLIALSLVATIFGKRRA